MKNYPPVGRKCDECGKAFTVEEWDERHESHGRECPNFGKVDWGDYDHPPLVDCNCDVIYHDSCCPECR